MITVPLPFSVFRALTCSALLAAAAFAQAPAIDIPAPSPASTLKQRVGLTDI
jgi:hypothetical protein